MTKPTLERLRGLLVEEDRMHPVGCATWIEEACVTVEEAADALEAHEKLLREAAALFRFYETSHLAKKTQDGDEKAYRNAEIAGRIEAALSSSQGRHEGGAFDLLKLAEVATKAVYTHGFGFREVVGPSERDGKIYVNFAWDDERLVRAVFFVSPDEDPSPNNTNPEAEHG